ncbi:unnamed protein product [Euphydryas editha]|uniref:Uncharacterized protein n=1 Tax=Euphydryas editha TaxID=104508 RepID=A0AAU9U575_EUPED|nr:unnamed protein product [Euphydryas editha]
MQCICIFALILCLSITCGLGDESIAEVKNADPACPGCEFNLNPNKPLYREMARNALRIYLRRVGIHQLHRVLQVERVTEQVVNGITTRINFSAAPSICLPNGGVQTVYWFNVLECYSETLEQSWLNKTDTKVSCTKLILN